MGKGSKVPPLPRRAPKAEGLTALAGSSLEEEGGAGTEAEERGDQQPASFQAPASLPQRVRGAGDRPRPPARVARPVLPESFLERVRAAAEAARREEDLASSDTAAGIAPTTRGSAFVAPPREAPTTEAPAPRAPARETAVPESPASETAGPEAPPPVNSTSLPQRVRGTSDGPQPPAHIARPVMSQSLLERVRAAIQADADAEVEEQSHEPAPIPLPRGGPGERGGAQHPAGIAQPVAGPETSSPGDAITQPIPVVSVTAEPATPAEKAVPVKPQAPQAPAHKPGKASGKPRAAEPKTGKPKAAEPRAGARTKPRPAPSTHARTTPRVPRTGPGTVRSAPRQARSNRSYRMAGVLAAALTVGALVLGYTVFHHTRGNSTGQSSAQGSSAGRSGGTRPVTLAAIRRSAATWVRAEVGSAAIISCDPMMCQALESHGLPTSQLLVLKRGVTSPLGSAVIVATPVLQNQIGSGLSSRYAPALLASFGSGGQQIQVRAIAPHGAAAYMSEAKADLALRKTSGSELAQNSRIVISAPARRELAAGEVDSRLMTVITDLAASHPVDILAFGESGPDTVTAPFRSAELAETNMQNMLAAVTAQEGPFRVAHMASARLSTGRLVLRIDFAAPSPFGLLGSG